MDLLSDPEQKHKEIVTFSTFGTIMSLLMVGSVVSNIRCFMLTYRLIRSKPSLMLVINLSISDLLVALVSWTAFMSQHISIVSGVSLSILVHKIIWTVLVALGNVTILTLTGLAADCFIALRWPLHYKEKTTFKTIRTYIGIIWTLSILSGGGDFILAAQKCIKEDSYMDAIHKTMVFTSSQNTVASKLFASLTLFSSNVLSALCLIALVIIYSYILIKIKKIQGNMMLSKRGGLKSELHAVRTTLMVFTSYILLWVPTLTINIMSVAKPDFLSKLDLYEASLIGYTADCLLMVHSIVDALIYGLRVSKTISRQRRSKLTLQDYLRAAKRESNYSSSSTFSRSPSKQNRGLHGSRPIFRLTMSDGEVIEENCCSPHQLQTIAEMCEVQPQTSDLYPSESEWYSHSGEEQDAMPQGQREEDECSIDEGIGTHSESGSEIDDNHQNDQKTTGSTAAARTLSSTALMSKLAIKTRPRRSNYFRSKSADQLGISVIFFHTTRGGQTNEGFVPDSPSPAHQNSLAANFLTRGSKHTRRLNRSKSQQQLNGHSVVDRLFTVCNCQSRTSKRHVIACTRL